jgi:hypothetical protein
MMNHFHSAISRESWFDNFKEIILGFIIRDDTKKITDFAGIGFNDIEIPNVVYHMVDKFFRSSSYNLNKLRDLWSYFLD